MSEFKIGDKVWVPRRHRSEVEITCPVCFGKLKVTVILGDGSEIETPCDYCGKGYGGPRGVVQDLSELPDADMVVIDAIETREEGSGVTLEYRAGCFCIKAREAFSTKGEAIEYAIEMAAKAEAENIKRAEYIKAQTRKTFTWNVGYHLREVKSLRERMKWHEKAAVLCKARAKEERNMSHICGCKKCRNEYTPEDTEAWENGVENIAYWLRWGVRVIVPDHIIKAHADEFERLAQRLATAMAEGDEE